nr:Plug domain-containing protein [Pseudomonas benzenivorans]
MIKRWIAQVVVFGCAGAAGEVHAFKPSIDIKGTSLIELMNMKITSVSKTEEKLSDAPAAVFVISHEDIRRSGVTSIPEALRLAPGVHVAREGAHSWAISIRGFNSDISNKLLVLIDGRSVYSPLFAGVFWDVQDTLLEDVDRIEVISGPGGNPVGGQCGQRRDQHHHPLRARDPGRLPRDRRRQRGAGLCRFPLRRQARRGCGAARLPEVVQARCLQARRRWSRDR